jgi:hypothetical protein
MTTERDPQTRLVLSWLREEAHENPERMLLRALDEVDTTPQRRSWWPAWRSSRMNTYAKLIASAAAVLLVTVVGYQFLPRNGGPGGQPTIAPSPSGPALIVRGTFGLYEGEVEVIATGSGDSVTGTMVVTHVTGNFTVDLKCTRTTEDGVILLAGNITESASPYALKGAREVLALKRGSPVYASFDSEGRDGGPLVPAASCPAVLEQAIDPGTHTVSAEFGLDPIEGGTVEFGH